VIGAKRKKGRKNRNVIRASIGVASTSGLSTFWALRMAISER